MLTKKQTRAIAAAKKELEDNTAIVSKIISACERGEAAEFSTPNGAVYGNVVLGEGSGVFYLSHGPYCFPDMKLCQVFDSTWGIPEKLMELKLEALRKEYFAAHASRTRQQT